MNFVITYTDMYVFNTNVQAYNVQIKHFSIKIFWEQYIYIKYQYIDIHIKSIFLFKIWYTSISSMQINVIFNPFQLNIISILILVPSTE